LLTEASAALVGSLIASRQPRNPVGWLIIAHALCFTLGEFARQYAMYGVLTNPGSLPFARAMASPAYWAWFPGLILMMSFLPLYFPNGRLLSSRWRPVLWFTVSAILIITSMTAVRPSEDETPGVPNPLGIEALKTAGIFEVIVPALWSVLAVVSGVSLILRFRRARGEERQQIKWVAYAVVMLIFFTILNQLLLQNLPPGWSEIFFALLLEGLWISIAVAIFRYRLYDIDVVINRTLVYGVLTLFLALIYFAGVVLLQATLHALTGQESSLAVVASTLLIAALFNPLRRRIQGFIDRRFYREKYDAAKTLEAFSATLRHETDLDALNEHLVAVARDTMRPAHVSLWLREPVQPEHASLWLREVPEDVRA
ncbi:MAG TPA: hypothetical protein VFI90_02795, partial [Rubrobacter sp.]|nr:hypothetical protein [Rubrobacter sp.]